MKTIIFCRHAERNDLVPVDFRVPNEVPSDEPITHLGHIQSELLANSLLEQIPKGSSVHIASSPFKRCVQTISKLAKELALPVHLEKGFSEKYREAFWDYNPYERLQIYEDFYGFFEGAEVIDSAHICVPKYPEDDKTHLKRILSVVESYINSRTEDVIVICSHFAFIRDYFTFLLGFDPKISSNYTIVSILAYRNSKFEVLKVGDFSHLPESHRHSTNYYK